MYFLSSPSQGFFLCWKVGIGTLLSLHQLCESGPSGHLKELLLDLVHSPIDRAWANFGHRLCRGLSPRGSSATASIVRPWTFPFSRRVVSQVHAKILQLACAHAAPCCESDRILRLSDGVHMISAVFTAWKKSALQTPPPKCLVFLLPISQHSAGCWTHVDRLAAEGCSGLLALREVTVSTDGVPKHQEQVLAQFLGVHEVCACSKPWTHNDVLCLSIEPISAPCVTDLLH